MTPEPKQAYGLVVQNEHGHVAYVAVRRKHRKQPVLLRYNQHDDTAVKVATFHDVDEARKFISVVNALSEDNAALRELTRSSIEAYSAFAFNTAVGKLFREDDDDADV